MSHHDVLAELQGYQAELDNAEKAKNTERADAVRAEIDRVRTEIEGRAKAAEAQARIHQESGQDAAAAPYAEDARRYRAALPEDTTQKAPRERAVPKKAGT